MSRSLSIRTILRRIERKIRSIEGDLYFGPMPEPQPALRRGNALRHRFRNRSGRPVALWWH